METTLNQVADLATNEYVDPATGEIIAMNEGGLDPSLNLANVGQAIIRHHVYLAHESARLNQVIDALKNQLVYAQELAAKREKGVRDRMAYLEGIGRRMLEQTGHKSVKLSGIGTFRFRSLPDAVDDSEWSGLTPEEQATLSIEHPELIRTVTTLKPDKKAIKARLQSGDEVRGFSIPDRPDVFEFEQDKESVSQMLRITEG